MKKPLRWAIVLGTLLLGLGLAGWLVMEVLEEREREHLAKQPAKRPRRVSRGPGGRIEVTLDPQTRKLAAIQIEPLSEITAPREAIAYGRFLEDPSRSFALRAPLPGILRSAEGRAWPALGDLIPDGQAVGRLEPRFAPAERIDLGGRLAAARAELDSARAALGAAGAALVRARTLNAEDKNLSDRALQEAEAKEKAEQARLGGAQETIRLLEAALAPGKGATQALLLAPDRGGIVIEVLAQPGEAVESGAVLLRLTRYDQLLARVSLAAGERLEGAVSQARIVPLGREENALQGERVSRSGPVDPRLLGDTFLFRVPTGDSEVRPGMAFTAYLPLPGGSLKGLLVPRSAVIRFGGKMWVYLEISPDKFSRKELAEARPLDKGWFVVRGFEPGEKVVVAGGELLLSEELSSQIQVEDEHD